MLAGLEKHKSLAEFEGPLHGQGEENLIIQTVKAPFSSHVPAGEKKDGKAHRRFLPACLWIRRDQCEIVYMVD